MTDPDTDLTFEIHARQQIVESLLRYCRGVDRCDADMVRSAFHPDAVLYHRPIEGGNADDFLNDYMLERQKGWESSQHLILNTSIELDGTVAHVESYFQAILIPLEREVAEMYGGRYVDHVTYRDGEWRIARRVTIAEWAVDVDRKGMDDKLRGAFRGSRDRSDPMYERPLVGPLGAFL
jgi:hypothetical protein